MWQTLWSLTLLCALIFGVQRYTVDEIESLNITNSPYFKTNQPANNLPNTQPRSNSITILPVPFTSQAPKGNWDEPYKESCEEASMIMVSEYYARNKQLQLNTDYADREILRLVDWEKKNLGFYEDTNAKEVQGMLKDYFNLRARILPFSTEGVKQAIQSGKPVILPAAGRRLKNPHYKRPGPLYHMIVVVGYQGDEFITNDPGTKFGQAFRYTTANLQRSVHDWNNGDVERGEQVMIIVDGLIL